ncbi:ABC transporter substrate-binding protein [Caballeronia sp. LZ034LL]|uniref:ABC transporter substrate-binding protein n=1 Tax=Caballeronia sp. LZ034LL TaxID=3038567 RepID=UPI00285D3F33|nr:ABC transporter substrate-binding protein [Caballeronia sp. LZ034LL]MDR5836038.1 ABC transporter substrate-binding protein [Caballeronia sp. LZ034LL]
MPNRREFFIKGSAVAGAGLLTSLSPLASRAFGAPAASGSTVLVANTLPEPAGLAAGSTPANPTNVVSSNLFDGLISYDENFKPVPQLATSWTESADRRTITFKLRDDVKWHDGTPFTSADVQYSIMEVSKKVHPIARPTFAQITAVDTPDAHTAVFRLAQPSPVIWAYLDTSSAFIFPKHLYAGTDPLTNPYNAKPVGTGAFVFKEWSRGNYIRLAKNPDYWDKGKPHVDELIFRIIPDASARSVALQNGTVQYAPLTPVSLIEARRLEKDPRLTVESKGWRANAPMFFMDFNLRRKQFQDVRVRRAIAHAINLKQLAQAVFYGFATPATGPVPSYQKSFYTADTPQYPYDPAKAEALLDEAGYKRDASGVRLRFNHLNHTYGEDYQRAGMFIQQQLKRIGVEVTLVNYDLPTYLRKVFTEHDFDTMNAFYAAFADPQIGVVRRYWSKNIIAGAAWSNGSGYASPEMDQVIETIQNEQDPQKRTQAIHQLQVIAQRDVPSINLGELKFFRIYSRRLQNVNTTPIGVYASLGDVSLSAAGGA